MNLLDQRLTVPGGMLTRINAISHFGHDCEVNQIVAVGADIPVLPNAGN